MYSTLELKSSHLQIKTNLDFLKLEKTSIYSCFFFQIRCVEGFQKLKIITRLVID